MQLEVSTDAINAADTTTFSKRHNISLAKILYCVLVFLVAGILIAVVSDARQEAAADKHKKKKKKEEAERSGLRGASFIVIMGEVGDPDTPALQDALAQILGVSITTTPSNGSFTMFSTSSRGGRLDVDPLLQMDKIESAIGTDKLQFVHLIRDVRSIVCPLKGPNEWRSVSTALSLHMPPTYRCLLPEAHEDYIDCAQSETAAGISELASLWAEVHSRAAAMGRRWNEQARGQGPQDCDGKFDSSLYAPVLGPVYPQPYILVRVEDLISPETVVATARRIMQASALGIPSLFLQSLIGTCVCLGLSPRFHFALAYAFFMFTCFPACSRVLSVRSMLV